MDELHNIAADGPHAFSQPDLPTTRAVLGVADSCQIPTAVRLDPGDNRLTCDSGPGARELPSACRTGNPLERESAKEALKCDCAPSPTTRRVE